MNRLKKYLTIMLLLGLTCPATACNSSSSSEDEVPPHLKPETPEEPGRDYYPKADGATRLVTYNVGVFTKYISDGSYQMIADMMTEGKADLVGISELDGSHRQGLPTQEVRRVDGQGVELRIFAGDGLSGRSLRRRNRQP